MAIRHQLAQIIRRTPALMLLPYYTYRFFQPKYSVGVIGVVMNGEGKILLVEHVLLSMFSIHVCPGAYQAVG
jgi:hypothetical protein